MTRLVGGQNYEGEFFIVEVPEDWNSSDPLPPPSPKDQWFDRQSDFERVLQSGWLRPRVRRVRCTTTSAES